MKTFKRAAAVAVAIGFLPYGATAAEPAAFIEFARPLGMGGAFTAVADDQNAFFYNPAGMVMRTGSQFTLLEVAAGGSQDTKKLADYIHDHKDELTHFNDLNADQQKQVVNDVNDNISKLNARVYAAADVASYVSGPTFLGLPIHVGYGAFAKVDGTAKLKPSVSGAPIISYAVNADAVLPISIAHRWNMPLLPGRIGVGVTGKFLRRGQIQQEKSTAELDDIKIPPAAIGHGFGSDLGFLYQPTDRANVGVMVEDFLGTKIRYDKANAKDGYPEVAAHDAVIRPRTNVGFAVVPKKLLWLIPSAERWTFSADLRDVFDKDNHVLFQNGLRKPLGENFGTHAYVGAEFRYWFLRFRGGAYQGYPSLGLGIDIPILKLDYAYYSRELGPLAGDEREINHVISLAIRFGAGNTEARERIRNNKDAKNITPDAIPESATSTNTTPETTPPANSTPETSPDIPR
jgi:hypothetical protein